MIWIWNNWSGKSHLNPGAAGEFRRNEFAIYGPTSRNEWSRANDTDTKHAPLHLPKLKLVHVMAGRASFGVRMLNGPA